MTTIKLRRGTAAQWTAANPILAAGEPGFETDTGKEKRGNGTSQWSELSYFLPENRLDLKYALIGQGGSGVTDHGLLTGRADDDHLQYHTDARGDARYILTTAKGAVSGVATLDVASHVPLAQLASCIASSATFVRGDGSWAVPVVGSGLTQVTKTASYTLVLADSGKLIEMNVAVANALTVPPNSSVAFPVGSVISVRQYGAGQTTITAGAGVTVRVLGGIAGMAGQYSEVTLTKRATDEWVLVGDVAAAPVVASTIMGGYNGYQVTTAGYESGSTEMSTDMGATIKYHHSFFDHNYGWYNIEGADGVMMDGWAGWVNAVSGRRFTMSLPMLPQKQGDGVTLDPARGDFAGLAAGNYDSHFTLLGAKFQARTALRNCIVRVGWEHNGSVWPL